jgi:phage FluMu protein Com
MQEIRCTNCNKLLAKVRRSDDDRIIIIHKNSTELDIKCPRCKTMNEFVV